MDPFPLTPLPVLLGIRPGSKVSVINPPSGFLQRLDPLPDGVEFLITARSGLDVILFFTESEKELVKRLPALSRAMAVTGGIWVCWPTREDFKGPLSEDFIRQAALEIGLIDNKRCSIDESWSALRLIWKPRPRLEKPRPRKSSPAAQA
jgi:hypothetical protein